MIISYLGGPKRDNKVSFKVWVCTKTNSSNFFLLWKFTAWDCLPTETSYGNYRLPTPSLTVLIKHAKVRSRCTSIRVHKSYQTSVLLRMCLCVSPFSAPSQPLVRVLRRKPRSWVGVIKENLASILDTAVQTHAQAIYQLTGVLL